MHPLPDHVLVDCIHKAWKMLWSSRIGPVALSDIRLDAQVVGKFFQEVLVRELQTINPGWHSARCRDDKDFVFCSNPEMSFELKMCGQLGCREVFGNRCSASEYASARGKDRSGWLLTINYHGQTINIIRFGWVPASEWRGQRAATGNSSRLAPNVYLEHLRVVEGPYRRNADVRVLPRIGKALHRQGIFTVGAAADGGNAAALDFLQAHFIPR